VVERIGGKLNELDLMVRISRGGKDSLIQDLMSTDSGKNKMDELRMSLDELQVLERDRTAALVEDWRANLLLLRMGVAAITALNIVLLVLIVHWLKRDFRRADERALELDRQVRARTTQLANLSSYLQEVTETRRQGSAASCTMNSGRF